MKLIGAHMSIAGGVHNAPLEAQRIKAQAFAMFTKNQKQWFAPPLVAAEIDLFQKTLAATGFTPRHVLPHDGYLINLGNADKAKRAQALKSFFDEMKRCEQLGLTGLNTHPGNHVDLVNEEQCLDLIAEAVNQALDKTKGVAVVLENTAGQGTSVGYRFEHLAHIVRKVEDKTRVGFCYDTCHGFAAGYDIRTPETYKATMQAIESTVGFNYLRGVHLNDAKAEFSSRVDRHEQIGQGHIGLAGFKLLMNDPRFDEVPMILETNDEEKWPEEIKLLYSLESKKKRMVK
jgi:deoxyribonuclease-4